MADTASNSASAVTQTADAPWTGGCACGAVRYTVTGKPAVMVECHCRQCQQDSGNDHADHVVFAGSQVELTGKLTTWSLFADSGVEKNVGFCPVCGSHVTLTFPARPDRFSVRAASLDDPSRFAPQVVTYTSRLWDIDRKNPAIPSFPGMPPR